MIRRQLAEHDKELGFIPRDCVRWLAPAALARTAVKVLVATIFADFADKRELQAVLGQEVLELAEPAPAAGGELWIDFAADLGDGFDATYTVASLLARNELTVTDTVGSGLSLPRGNLLLFGGDEVYPTASPGGYEDKTTGPYAAALPADAELPPGNTRPSLVALPGNHDWYDGLTSFLRVFDRGRQIGAWRLVQTRSYFALNPMPGWWIVGLDSQLGQYIDQPQLEYFRRNVSAALKPGDGIILCAAAPMWVHTKTKDPDAFNSLHYFEKNFLRNRVNPDTGQVEPTGAHVRLWITGDSHHYCRYEEAPPRSGGPDAAQDLRPVQMITCGLGGAFLADTHHLPPDLTLPPPESRMRSKDTPGKEYVRGPVTFPDAGTSRQLALQIANPFSPTWIAWRNPWFGVSIGAVHVLAFTVMVLLFSVWVNSPVVTLLRYGVTGDALLLAAVVIGVPLAIVGLNVLFGQLRERGGLTTWVTTLTAVVFQLIVLVLLLFIVMLLPWPGSWPDGLVLAAAAAMVWVLGMLFGSEAFALYTLTRRTGQVAMWQMSGQAIEDYKGFARIRMQADSLTVYPIAVDRICRDWDLEDLGAGLARPVAADGALPEPRLLEEPITISRQGFPP